MLAVGPSTLPWPRGDSNGLFTTVDVEKDTILCIKKGLLLNNNFWYISEYNTSDMRQIKMANLDNGKPYTCTLDKDDSVSYSDFVKDSLDPKLVNAEFIEIVDKGPMYLKCIKRLKACSELFISFGKMSWISEFKSYDWSLSNRLYISMVKRAMSVYHISKAEIIKAATDYRISPIIKNYISSHMAWENSDNHSYMNVLVWKENGCYINCLLQCLARIPALTQLLLDTDLFQNTEEKTRTFLDNYITLLKLMTGKKEKETTMKKYNNFILDKRLDLGPAFIPGAFGDAIELFIALIDKFVDDNPLFKFVKYHLFGYYYKTNRYCSNNHHSFIQEIQYYLTLSLNDITTSENNSLKSGIIQSMTETGNTINCPFCNLEKKDILQMKLLNSYTCQIYL